MLQRSLVGRLVLFSVIFAGIGSSLGQSIFRVGAWCLYNSSTSSNLWAIYEPSPGVWRVKGPERDKLLNLGLNHFIGCINLNGEDAMVFMGDSLDAAPVRKEFESTLGIIPPIPYFSGGAEIARLTKTAHLYLDPIQKPNWEDSVTTAYNAMHTRHQNRIDGVHSFFSANEDTINKPTKTDGINFMCNNSIVDSYVVLGYVQQPDPVHMLTSYEMAKRLTSADHVAISFYALRQNPWTPYSGTDFQARLSKTDSAFKDVSRGIRDGNSAARFWGIVQTQESPVTTYNLRLPTKEEILCSVNLALAKGAKGIAYYTYSTFTTSGKEESGLLDVTRNTTTQYNNVKDINTNYQGTGQSLVTIGGNFLNLTWKESFAIHQNLTEPISSTYKIYDATAKIPGGATDAANQTYVEVGVLQNTSSVNHYMVVNRRCTSSETREVTMVFQSTTNNAYRITDVFSGCTTTYYPAGGTTFSYTLTLGPGQGKLLKLEDLGAWSGIITSTTTWSCAVVVKGNIIVNSGVTLNVSSGTSVRFDGNYSLTIQSGARLIAEGDQANQITFTTTTGTLSNKYKYVQFQGGDNSLKWCIFEYGTYPLYL